MCKHKKHLEFQIIEAGKMNQLRPWFNSQHPQGISQLSRTPAPENLMAFSDLCRYQTHTHSAIYTCRKNIDTHKIILKIELRI